MRTRAVLTVLMSLALLGLSMQGCTLLNFDESSATIKPKPGAEDTFKEGEELLAEGKYKQARAAYSKVKEYDPEKFYDPLVQIRMGDSYYEEGSYAEAEVEYQRFIDLRPQNKAAPYVKYQIGMCNFKQIREPYRDPQFAEAAVKNFSELLRDYPDNPYKDEATEKLRLAKDSLAKHEYFVGKYYYDTDAYKAAAGRFKGIIERFPGASVEPETLYYLADSYIRLGEFDNAKSTLAVLYQEHPNDKMAQDAKDDLAPEIPAQPEKPQDQ
jgi:outer membrane protein assembly factor BamD